jgi:3',5'-cyclic AMP phosphodiesterase CpdA
MTQVSRRTFLEIASLASAGLLGGCGGSSGGNWIIEPGDFSVPVFSDVHFQPFIDPYEIDKATLNPATTAANMVLAEQLDAADASAWPAILAAANSPPSAFLTDTNYTLLGLALDSIKQNLGTSPAVLFTGDFLGHGMNLLYLSYTATANKTSADADAFVDKTLTFVLQQIRTAMGATPLYFTLGNCDSYTDEGPDSTFLANNAQQLYTLALNGVGNEQDVINSITNGGYYSVEPAGSNLMIVALNTFALSPGITANATMIANQFAWFETKLAEASNAGKKVWLLMHAPPGAVEDTTAESSNDINGQITTATMMWTDSNRKQFMGIIDQYPGVIAMSLAGHTHMDEFRLMSPGVALAPPTRSSHWMA